MSRSCLDELEAIALVERKLGDEEREAVTSHMDECVECQQLVAALARATPERRQASPWVAIAVVVATLALVGLALMKL